MVLGSLAVCVYLIAWMAEAARPIPENVGHLLVLTFFTPSF